MIELELRFKGLLLENRQLQKELEIALQDKQQLATRLEVYRNRIEFTEKNLYSSNNFNTSANQEILNLKQELETLQQAYRSQIERNESLSDRLSLSQNEHREKLQLLNSDYRNELSNFKQQIQQLQSENCDLIKERNSMIKIIDDLEIKLTSVKFDGNSKFQIEELEKRCMEKDTKLQEIQINFDKSQAEIIALRKNEKQLQKNLDYIRDEVNAGLQQDLRKTRDSWHAAAAIQDNSNSRLKAQINDLTAGLEESLAACGSEKQKVAQKESKINSLQQELENLRRRLATDVPTTTTPINGLMNNAYGSNSSNSSPTDFSPTFLPPRSVASNEIVPYLHSGGNLSPANSIVPNNVDKQYLYYTTHQVQQHQWAYIATPCFAPYQLYPPAGLPPSK